MNSPVYVVDAFHCGPFTGNPAAVCPLDGWLDESLLQQIAGQNNLSETAFLVRGGHADCWRLRWFTPTTEVDLCGHATLASAHVLIQELGLGGPHLQFETRSGRLSARSLGDHRYGLDFPARALQPLPNLEKLSDLLGLPVVDGTAAIDDWIIELENRDAVADYRPDFSILAALDARGIIVTARDTGVDFVSRFFGPRVGVNEDPVTGSAHCSLAPYWAERLGRERMVARQLSSRGGELTCQLQGQRVLLEGRCRTWLNGQISLSDEA